MVYYTPLRKGSPNTAFYRIITRTQFCFVYQVTARIPIYWQGFDKIFIDKKKESFYIYTTSINIKYFFPFNNRDRLTADDIIGTKFLPLSSISKNGDGGMLMQGDHL